MAVKTKKTRLKQAAQVAAQSKDDVVAYTPYRAVRHAVVGQEMAG